MQLLKNQDIAHEITGKLSNLLLPDFKEGQYGANEKTLKNHGFILVNEEVLHISTIKNIVYVVHINNKMKFNTKTRYGLRTMMEIALQGNTGGRMSGYKLAKDQGQVHSIYDIYKAFERELLIADCLIEEENGRQDYYCAAREFWHGLNELMVKYLAEKQQEINEQENEHMFFI